MRFFPLPRRLLFLCISRPDGKRGNPYHSRQAGLYFRWKPVGIATAFVLLFWVSMLGAAEYYVAPGGSDAHAGTLLSPWNTIQHALNVLSSGDSLWIRGGDYYENLVITNSGLPQSPISISAYNNEKVISHGGIEFARAVSHIRIDELIFGDFSEWGVFLRGENRDIQLRQIEVSGGETGIRLTYGYSGEDALEGGVDDIRILDSVIEGALYSGSVIIPWLPAGRMKLEFRPTSASS